VEGDGVGGIVVALKFYSKKSIVQTTKTAVTKNKTKNNKNNPQKTGYKRSTTFNNSPIL
jgi:hypothetical protein